MNWKNLSIILGCIIAAGTIITGITKAAKIYDNNLVKKPEFQLLESRLEQKIVTDKVDYLQQRIWSLEDRYGGVNIPNCQEQSVREEYRKLKVDLEEEKGKLEKIKK